MFVQDAGTARVVVGEVGFCVLIFCALYMISKVVFIGLLEKEREMFLLVHGRYSYNFLGSGFDNTEH